MMPAFSSLKNQGKHNAGANRRAQGIDDESLLIARPVERLVRPLSPLNQ